MELTLEKLLNFVSVKIRLSQTFVAETEKENVFNNVLDSPSLRDEIL